MSNLQLPGRRTRRKHPRLKWFYIPFSILIVLLLLSAGAISFTVAYKLSHPSARVESVTPADAGLKYRNVSFYSRRDHIKLSGWVIPSVEQTHKWLILAHGYRQNRLLWGNENEGLDFYQYLHQLGYQVMTFDFRNSGTSGGTLTTVGALEKRDILGAVDAVKQLDPDAEIGLMGWSMGASTALLAASGDPSVEAVVAEAPFTNLGGYLEDNLSKWSHLPSFPFTPIILNICFQAIAHFDPESVSPINAVARDNMPILLVHAKGDPLIPYRNSAEIENRYQQDHDIKLLTLNGDYHAEAFIHEPKAYEKGLEQFFRDEHFLP